MWNVVEVDIGCDEEYPYFDLELSIPDTTPRSSSVRMLVHEDLLDRYKAAGSAWGAMQAELRALRKKEGRDDG